MYRRGAFSAIFVGFLITLAAVMLPNLLAQTISQPNPPIVNPMGFLPDPTGITRPLDPSVPVTPMINPVNPATNPIVPNINPITPNLNPVTPGGNPVWPGRSDRRFPHCCLWRYRQNGSTSRAGQTQGRNESGSTPQQSASSLGNCFGNGFEKRADIRYYVSSAMAWTCRP